MGNISSRRHNPHIPAHIDQKQLPPGIYFDHRKGDGRWYTLTRDETGCQRRRNVANHAAALSDLRKIVEENVEENRGTLKWLSDEFQRSEQFKALTPSTRRGYQIHCDVLCHFPTKIGPLGNLDINKFSSALIQRIVDKIGRDKPSTAVHCLQYLRRLLQWGKNRGHCNENPARKIELPKQRKRRRLPEHTIMDALIAFARERGQRQRGEKGACPGYLWCVMEIGYLCRLRGIEVVTLTDGQWRADGLKTNRRKGSRDNIVRWNPRLQNAWNAAAARRDAIWAKKKFPAPLAPEKRQLIVADHGGPLQKSSLDTAYQRLIHMAIKENIIRPEERFGLHDLKRRGITDTPGTRAEKQEASGHREESMLDIYDFSVPMVEASAQ